MSVSLVAIVVSKKQISPFFLKGKRCKDQELRGLLAQASTRVGSRKDGN